MVLVSTAITYPTPSMPAGQRSDQSGQHDGPDPNFPTHSPQTSNPPKLVRAFVQVTGLRPQNLMTAKKGRFRYPRQV